VNGLVGLLLVFWLVSALGKKRPSVPWLPPAPARQPPLGLLRALFYLGLWIALVAGLRSPIVWLSGRAAGPRYPDLAVILQAVLSLGLVPFLAYAPAWLVFRILKRVDGRTARCVLWLWPHGSRQDREASRVALRAILGLPLAWTKSPLAALPWTTCAAALQAEAQGDGARAERLLRGLLEHPGRRPLPRPVAVYGVEALAEAAAARGDWPAVGRRCALGRGRGVRLLRLLARARTGGGVAPPLLVVAWLLAPRRRARFPLVRTVAHARPEPGEVAGEPALSPRAPWSAQLRLLAHAARGGDVSMAAMVRLARHWERRFRGLDEARLRARALELGSRNSAAAVQALRERVVAELEALAWAAPGALPAGSRGALAAEVFRRVRDRVFDSLRPYQARVIKGEVGPPLEEWAAWLAYREAVERVRATAGPDGWRTAWYASVRTTAWNWPVQLYNAHRAAAAWACVPMFAWVAEAAEALDDAEAVATNRRNVEIARAAVP
jgi:hypothetical protein